MKQSQEEQQKIPEKQLLEQQHQSYVRAEKYKTEYLRLR
jgi:hypothetical protein